MHLKVCHAAEKSIAKVYINCYFGVTRDPIIQNHLMHPYNTIFSLIRNLSGLLNPLIKPVKIDFQETRFLNYLRRKIS